jgi:hypothetical protein
MKSDLDKLIFTSQGYGLPFQLQYVLDSGCTLALDEIFQQDGHRAGRWLGASNNSITVAIAAAASKA